MQSFNKTFGTAPSTSGSPSPKAAPSKATPAKASTAKKQAAAVTANDPRNTVKGSALRRMQGAGTAAQSSSGSGGTEECPVCHARFGSVNELISHSEAVHSGQESAEGASAGPDICPKCQRAFSDPVTLIRHVETEHFGNSSRQSSSTGLVGFFKRTLDSFK